MPPTPSTPRRRTRRTTRKPKSTYVPPDKMTMEQLLTTRAMYMAIFEKNPSIDLANGVDELDREIARR